MAVTENYPDLDRLLEKGRAAASHSSLSFVVTVKVPGKELVALIERLKLAEFLLKDMPDHADLDAAQFKINMVVAEANAKIRTLEVKLRAAKKEKQR